MRAHQTLATTLRTYRACARRTPPPVASAADTAADVGVLLLPFLCWDVRSSSLSHTTLQAELLTLYPIRA